MFGKINVSCRTSVWDVLEDIDNEAIEKYLSAKNVKNEKIEKELKDHVFYTYVDVDADDALELIDDYDVKSHLEFQGYIVKDSDYDPDDDFYEDWETLAEDVSKLSHFDIERFFKEFMRHKRIYRNEELIEIIKNIKL